MIETLPDAQAVRLDAGLSLRGSRLEVSSGGRQIEMALFWEAANPLPGRYALFVHLTPAGSGASSAGSEPVIALTDIPALFTDNWPDGTRWQTVLGVTVPEDVAPGAYRLYAGWFDTETGARLAVDSDDPAVRAGLIDLGAITVE